jgi:hypothetical protein
MGRASVRVSSGETALEAAERALAGWNLPSARESERSGRGADPFRMLPTMVQRLMTTLPWAWPSRMY